MIAFWVVIGALLLWQFYAFNKRMTQSVEDHPAQTTFIFLHTNAPAAERSLHNIRPNQCKVFLLLDSKS